MQAVLFSASSLSLTPIKNSLSWRPSPKHYKTKALPRFKTSITAAPSEPSTVDYSSSTSVFPAEACETVGGEACSAEMYPEVNPKSEAGSAKVRVVREEVDREYVEYSEPKTVFPGEACDDLGGEFCEPEYQQGVYQEKILSK